MDNPAWPVTLLMVEGNVCASSLHTTGQPKGVQHPVGGHAVVNKWTMEAIYGVQPGETWWAASDLGWIVGHEYTCYSPLLARCVQVDV